MKDSIVYSLKVWLTAVIVSPAIFCIIDIFTHRNIDGFFSMTMLFMFFGGLFSIPSMLVLWIAVYLIKLVDWRPDYQKIILSVTGISLTLLPFMLFATELLVGDVYYAAVYATIIVMGVWIYNLHPKEGHNDEPAIE